MTIKEAIELFKQHQKSTVKKSTLKSYGRFLEQLKVKFTEEQVISVSPDDIGKFLEESTEGLSRPTRHLRYAQIKSFFNYVIESTGLNIKNPCNASVLSKEFKNVQHRPRTILDKETVDEIISKIILRHQDLKTTQIYLGKISDNEAIRWIDILHGR